MQIRELSIPNSYEITPVQRSDDRGTFLEWYRFDLLEQTIGHPLDLRQANTSISRKGTVRGIHFADVPRGQAKYVTAMHGAVMDFVVDIRVGSPTFGQWDSVVLDDIQRKAIYISEGLGHMFVALTEGAIVSYLVTDVYAPDREHGLNPLDPTIDIDFPIEKNALLLSPKDLEAPSLMELHGAGRLPQIAEMHDFYSSLNAKLVN